jgi:hypothetical protein
VGRGRAHQNARAGDTGPEEASGLFVVVVGPDVVIDRVRAHLVEPG